MVLYFNKGTDSEEVYTNEQIKSMNKSELKSLVAKCQLAQSEISMKRNRYKNENEEDKNSKVFWTKMNNYKQAITIYQRAIFELTEMIKKAEPTPQQKDNEHWLWCYYQESLKLLTDEMVSQITEMADNRAKYHIEFEKWEPKEIEK